MLSEGEVVEIYKLKISILNQLFCCEDGACNKWIRGKSIPIAARYRVSSRAIRDIWNRKTWAYATQYLWSLEGINNLPNHQVDSLNFILKVFSNRDS